MPASSESRSEGAHALTRTSIATFAWSNDSIQDADRRKDHCPVYDARHGAAHRREANSFRRRQQFRRAARRGRQGALRHHKLAANQVLYHLKERGIERKLIPHCQRNGIAIVAYSPFGHEALPRPGSAGGKVLEAVAQRNSRTVRQVILNFLTRLDGTFTIPKSSSIEHTRENVGGAGWTLSPNDLEAIDHAFPAPTRDVPLGMI